MQDKAFQRLVMIVMVLAAIVALALIADFR